MSESMTITTLHGIEISYDPEKKQFRARVGGREFKKPSQAAIEKIITKFHRGSERVRGVILDFGWREPKVIQIEIVGLRGRKVQYRSGQYIESEDLDNVYHFDERLVEEAAKLNAEHADWLKRWEALVAKAKNVSAQDLR